MAEPMLREPVEREAASHEEAQATATDAARDMRSANQELRERVQAGWEELKDRIANATAANRRLFRDLRDDVDKLRVRAGRYHEDRPLQALGMVASAAFAVGLLVGLRRR